MNKLENRKKWFSIKSNGCKFRFYIGSKSILSLSPIFISKFVRKFKKNHSFDCRKFDNQIATFVAKTFDFGQQYKVEANNSQRIVFLATEYYDYGGHTVLASNLLNILKDKYEIANFVVNEETSKRLAPVKLEQMKKKSPFFWMQSKFGVKNILKCFFLQIVEYNPKVIFVFTHMNDFLGTATLCMIKKFTKIKVIYFNHGSHYPALGFSFADLIIEGMPTTHYVTKKYRGVDKCARIGIFDQKIEEIKYFTSEEIVKMREKMGVSNVEKMTLSGGASYKFFEKKKSDYFEMIKRLLERNNDMRHFVMSNFTPNQKRIINSIFTNSQARKRLVLIPLSSEYPLVFQSCDLFIDSFPISAALSQIELMKWKVPTVVKINRDNALFSFHEYFPENYKYMYETSYDMEQGINDLLYNKEEQKRVTEDLFSHFCKKYEGGVIRDIFVNMIENSDHLDKFYDTLSDDISYNLKVS